jgi:hypothetical protein
MKYCSSATYNVLSENQVMGSRGLRPDLVLRKGPKINIVDATVVFENRMMAFLAAAEEKRTKYEELRLEMAAQHVAEVAVVPFIIGSLGAWDPDNNSFLRLICSRSYGKLLQKLCVSETIKFTRDIYIEHITGVRQTE